MAIDRPWRLPALAMVAAMVACASGGATEEPFAVQRRRMVEEQIKRRGVTDAAVLAAMQKVPRHLFVPVEERAEAYGDHPLPIGLGQTISQPYIVALMASLVEPGKGERVLEIGTGSGYQAAVLSELAREVYSIEIVAELGLRARRTLEELGYDNVEVRIGDGFQGWPDRAPFDAIVVTAAPPRVPEPLLSQLKTGGKLVVPVGDLVQTLVVYSKRRDGGFDRKEIIPVRFVPMTGEVQKTPPP